MLGNVRDVAARARIAASRAGGTRCHDWALDFVWWEIRNHVDTLLSETQAAAISFVSWTNEGVVKRINRWVAEFFA